MISQTESMDTIFEVMETGTSGMTGFLLKKSESNGDLSHTTDSTDPTDVEYSFSSNSFEDEVWSGEDEQTLNSLLEDEDDQTLSSLLEDDEDSLYADQDDSEPGRFVVRTRLDKQVPSEIVVIQESPMSLHSSSTDELSQLQEAELLAQCYKEKVQSTERSGDLLHKYLQKTQGHAQELASENQDLRYAIAEMSREEVMRHDQDLLFKTLIGACFVFYMFGGSEYYLAAPVGLYLLCSIVSFFL